MLIFCRLKSEWRLKLILLVVLNLTVYAPYLVLQHYNLFRATVMPMTFFDRLIPFSPQTVWIYLSIYLLMPIGPFMMTRRDQIVRYAIGIISIGLIADFVFLFWPTTCPRPNTSGTNALYQSLVSVDNRFHAFPSLHAAFAIYSAGCGGMVIRELSKSRMLQASLWFWAFLILLATLTTKQHVMADIIAGSALGFGVYSLVFKKWKFTSNAKRALPLASPEFTQSNSSTP